MNDVQRVVIFEQIKKLEREKEELMKEDTFKRFRLERINYFILMLREDLYRENGCKCKA